MQKALVLTASITLLTASFITTNAHSIIPSIIRVLALFSTFVALFTIVFAVLLDLQIKNRRIAVIWISLSFLMEFLSLIVGATLLVYMGWPA